MTCSQIRRRLSDHIDGDVDAGERSRVASHLADCPGCALHLETLQATLAELRSLPRLQASESLAFQVLNRLEVESYGPGLALLFRPAWMARPLILPSLVPAALVLVSVLAGALALGHEPRRGVSLAGSATEARVAPPGTEANPLFPSAEVSVPRVRDTGRRELEETLLLADLRQGSLFIETVVARDGRVVDVKLLDGQPAAASAILKALRQERFEPGRRRGRPVAVAVYRLISHMEVTASTT